MTDKHHIPEFGEAVKTVLREHGLSLRSQRIRTGIDHMTMKEMCDGIRVRVEKVEQFARAFGLDVNEWRELAGYPAVEDTEATAALAGAQRLLDGLTALQRKYPRKRVLIPDLRGGIRSLTVEEADLLLVDIERILLEEPDE